MARKYVNFLEGVLSQTLGDQAGDTTMNGSALAALGTVSGGDIVVIVLDPEAIENGPEVVHVTAHTGTDTSATILRAQEDTTRVEHPSGTKFVAALTKAGIDAILSDVADALSDISTLNAHVGAGGSAHANAVAGGAAGFMTGSDKTKLNGIESGATADLTASEILTLIKTVDGSGSGLDADLLDGNNSSAFAASSHNHAASAITSGTIAIARIPTGTSSSTCALGNHTHSYLPLSGGTITGGLNVDNTLTCTRDGSVAAKFYRTDTTGGIVSFSSDAGGADTQKAFIDASDGSYDVTSDERFKENIRDADSRVQALLSVPVREFTAFGQESLGVVAQEVEAVLPELVTEHEGLKTVNQTRLVWLLLQTVQELAARVEALESAR